MDALPYARKRLGLRQSSGAFEWGWLSAALGKAPEDWRSPKPVGPQDVGQFTNPEGCRDKGKPEAYPTILVYGEVSWAFCGAMEEMRTLEAANSVTKPPNAARTLTAF